MPKTTAKTNRIGVHVSVAGGVNKAPARAAELGCETFQCFTRPPQGGPAPLLTPELVQSFRTEMDKYQLETFHIHTPYYLNYASLKPAIRATSIRVAREELERGSQLGAGYVMTHLGSHTGQTEREGIERVVEAVQKILKNYSGQTEFLLEIAAGSGNIIGDTFAEIGEIVKAVKSLSGFGGVCFDTCHAFASGYDFSTPAKAETTLAEFDGEIGLRWLKLSHVNDSKFALGQKKDRHEHIGKGFIGQAGLAAILQAEPFMKIDWLLETEDDDRANDLKLLKAIRT